MDDGWCEELEAEAPHTRVSLDRSRSAISWARSIFSGVSGHHEPDATVLSLAITTVSLPWTRTNAVITPAPGEGRPPKSRP